MQALTLALDAVQWLNGPLSKKSSRLEINTHLIYLFNPNAEIIP